MIFVDLPKQLGDSGGMDPRQIYVDTIQPIRHRLNSEMAGL